MTHGSGSAWRKLRNLDQYFLDHPTPFRPEIAAIVNEGSLLRMTEAGSLVSGQCIYRAGEALGRVGAPYGQYLLDDVLAGRVRAKLYVLLNAWTLNAEQRTQLETVTRDASTIWCYTAPSAAKNLAAFKISPTSPQPAWASPTGLAAGKGLHTAFGLRQKVTPLFSPAAATAEETLFRYADGKPAVAINRRGGHLNMFIGAHGLDERTGALRPAEAGVHLFTQQDCNVYASGPFVVLHASQDGAIDLDVGKPAELRDVLSGTRVAPDMTLRKGETRILRY